MRIDQRRIVFAVILSLLCVWLICATGQFVIAQPPLTPLSDDSYLVSAEYKPLEMYIGAWKVRESHFDVNGKVIATVTGTEENRWILDNHAIQRTYITSTDTNIYRAVGIFTWIAKSKKYHGVWFDNASVAGPNVVTGEWNVDSKTFVYSMTTSSPANDVKYNIVEKFVDEETRVATTYEVRGSTVTKKLEVRYTRSVPCPDKMRYVPDIDQG